MKKSKLTADYRPKPRHANQNCGNCLYMHDDGTCTLVQGLVDSAHICNYWEPEAKT